MDGRERAAGFVGSGTLLTTHHCVDGRALVVFVQVKVNTSRGFGVGGVITMRRVAGGFVFDVL